MVRCYLDLDARTQFQLRGLAFSWEVATSSARGVKEEGTLSNNSEAYLRCLHARARRSAVRFLAPAVAAFLAQR